MASGSSHLLLSSSSSALCHGSIKGDQFPCVHHHHHQQQQPHRIGRWPVQWCCSLKHGHTSRKGPKSLFPPHIGMHVCIEKVARRLSLGSMSSAVVLLDQGHESKYAASCMTWDAASVDNNTEELLPENGQTDATSAGSSHRREPWIARLMSGFSKTKEPWTVPWTSFTVVQVMFLWFCTFWLVGSWVIPFAAHCVGYSRDSLTYRGQALYSLITDVAEGTVGLSILKRCLSRFHPLPKDWFPFSWRGYWYIDVLLGCLTFPIVNRLSQINLDLLPLSAPLASSYEQSIMARDPVASLVYAIVVSICCPIWEEVIFRGFLLPSLTRYLPVWASIFVSAVVFGLAHFNVQRVLPLSFLGLVMGIMFVRTRNLLPSMLLHSLWNGFVFLGLLR